MRKCSRCGEEKPPTLEFFYRAIGVESGLTIRCRDCVKAATAERHERLQSTPEGKIAELRRCRKKMRKYRAEGKAKKPIKYGKYSEKQKKACTTVKNAVRDGRLKKLPCCKCGFDISEGHHENYDEPLNVVWLCVKHHNERHVYLHECKILKIEPKQIEEWLLLNDPLENI